MTETKFCRKCGAKIDIEAEICPKCGVRQYQKPPVANKKDKMTAALLALFLGGIGAHNFYLGQQLTGLLYLVFCWTFIPAILGLIEGLNFLCMSQEQFDTKYNK